MLECAAGSCWGVAEAPSPATWIGNHGIFRKAARMADDVASVARRWFEEVWNQRREATIDELLTPESVCYADDGRLVGPQDFRERMYVPFQAAFPDVQVTIEDVLATGDQAVVRWTATATHLGPGLEMAPTGRPITFRGMTWMRVAGGKLMEGWQCSNIPEALRTLREGAPGGS
jgi:predicted ester cyclase